MRSLRGPGGWHSATENPRPAPGEKQPRASETVSPGPEHQRGLLPCLGHSFVLGPSDPFCVTHLDMCCLCHFRFFKHTGTFFFFNQHFKKIPPPFGTRGPPASRPAGASRVRGSCWAIPSQHCFPLCLYVSKGNCTAKALRAWNSAWGCFGYIKVFASVLPDLNGDFTSTELKRRGRRASPGEAASERRRERAERAREKGQRITSSLGLGSSGKDMTHSG